MTAMHDDTGRLDLDEPVPYTLTAKAHAALIDHPRPVEAADYIIPMCPGGDPGADWREMGWDSHANAALAHVAWCPNHPGYWKNGPAVMWESFLQQLDPDEPVPLTLTPKGKPHSRCRSSTSPARTANGRARPVRVRVLRHPARRRAVPRLPGRQLDDQRRARVHRMGRGRPVRRPGPPVPGRMALRRARPRHGPPPTGGHVCSKPRSTPPRADGTFSRSAPAPRDQPAPTTTRTALRPAPTPGAATGTPDGNPGPPPTRAASAGDGPAAPFNIGIACGPSRLVVVDLDTPKPGDTPPPEWNLPGIRTGADVLAALCERAGEPYPAGTWTVRHAQRGNAPVLRRAARRPGTAQHPRGRPVGWGGSSTPGPRAGTSSAAGSVVDGRPYTVTCDTPPAPLPGWLAERLRPAPLPPQRPVDVSLPAGRAGGYLRAAVDSELARVLGSPPRGHNTALYRAAVALGQLVAGGALSEADVTAWLTEAAGQVGQRPGETARTIASGLRAGAPRPRSVAA